jgi:CHAT domain-containing protein
MAARVARRLTSKQKGAGNVRCFPDKPTDQDDGLLWASEISELKLNAHSVVPSACNTAASDGVGAEAPSGLARAFFYAGARSLVVSDWDVVDDETALLMSDLFKRSSQNQSLSHGEALQQVQLNILGERQRRRRMLTPACGLRSWSWESPFDGGHRDRIRDRPVSDTAHSCVYQKLRLGRSGDEVRLGWQVT